MLDAKAASRVLNEARVVFLFAPNFHPAMKHVAPVRRELGTPTLMNLIGPLANPASVRRQVVGVADPDRAGIVAEALVRLGTEHALVVHGRVGMDEISPQGITDVWEVKDGAVRQWEIDPQRFRLAITDVSELQGGDPAANAERVERILGNGSAPADPAGLAAVLLNAGAAIYVAGIAGSLAEGIGRAREVVASGAARAALDRLRKATASIS
jgi:anthranilate phosphoribosyltransferase